MNARLRPPGQKFGKTQMGYYIWALAEAMIGTITTEDMKPHMVVTTIIMMADIRKQNVFTWTDVSDAQPRERNAEMDEFALEIAMTWPGGLEHPKDIRKHLEKTFNS